MLKSQQANAKGALQEIWQAGAKEGAEKAFDLFVEKYEPKYSKATTCLEKDREELMAFYDFTRQALAEYTDEQSDQFSVWHLSSKKESREGLTLKEWHASHDVQTGPVRTNEMVPPTRL